MLHVINIILLIKGVKKMDRTLKPPEKEKKIVKIFLISIIVLSLLIMLRSFILKSFATATANRVELRIAEVIRKDLISSFIAEGKLIPLITYQTETPVSGKVERILKKIGDTVQKGDTLITMSNDDLQLQLINSEIEVANQINNLSTARIQSNQSRLSHKRLLFTLQNQLTKLQREMLVYDSLNEKKLVSEDEYLTKKEELLILKHNLELSTEEAKIDSLMRKQQISQIEQSLNQVQNNLQQMKNKVFDLIIKAPINGQITELNATAGQMLGSGHKIAVLEDNRHFYIQAKINQYYQNHLQKGLRAKVTSFSDSVYVLIDNIHPRLEGNNLVVDFKGVLPENLRSGQSVSLELQTTRINNILSIPIGEYLAENNYKSVFVLNKTGHKAERRIIETGSRSIADIEIISGLIEGEKVLISSNSKWKNKTFIKIK